MRRLNGWRSTPRTAIFGFAAFFGLILLLQGAKCPSIPDMQTTEITVVIQESVEFPFEARGGINATSGDVTIDIDEIRQDLEDNDIEVDQIDTVVVRSVLYGVTAYNETELDREIVDGYVRISRTSPADSAVIFDNVDVMVYPLLGELVPAPIDEAGVDFLNSVLGDVLTALRTGYHSELTLRGTVSGLSEPQARDTNFDWRVVIYYQIAGRMEIDVPDF